MKYLPYILITATSFVTAIFALFSGFGLGSVLMPVFALFFSLPIAIAAVAVVHLASNIFNAFLVGKLANWRVVLTFGIPAALAAALGAYLLDIVYRWPSLFSYQINQQKFEISPIGLLVGLIIIVSACFVLVPRLSKLTFSERYIPVGGLLSGFFGGISGNQGSLRSAFLIKAGLKKEEFIGTSVIASIIVDVSRLLIYGWSLYIHHFTYVISHEMKGILVAASLAAFLGAYIGSTFISKITLKALQLLVGIMLLILGIAISLGIAGGKLYYI
jgi:uncharacterized protein